MKRIGYSILALVAMAGLAYGVDALQQYQPGFRLIDGSQLNKMVDVVNSLTGHGGTPVTGYFSANTGTGPTPATGTVLQVVGANAAAAARIEVDSFGGVPIVSVRRANGTKAAPTAVVSADQLGSFNYHGTTSASAYYGPAARIAAFATENWSGTAGGSRVVISTTPNTTQTLADIATFGQDGSLILTGAYKGPAAATVSSAGGTFTVTGAAGGSTSGAGGAISVTGGSATSGAGGTVTITGGAAGTGTNAGGDVNLVGGAQVSTGIPGTIKINGSNILTCATYAPSGTPAATDVAFFIATRAYLVVSVSEVHSTAAGGASNIQLVKDTGTAAPGTGTDLLTNNTNAGFDLNGTANTVQTGTLTATIATKSLAAGDRLSVDYANAIQSSAGVVITACMAPI